jgi:hypothetical protein
MRTSSTGCQFATWAPLAVVLIVLLPALSAAQEPVTSFGQLGDALKVGNRVRVTDTENREVSGKITALDGKSLTLDTAGGTTLSAERVRSVQRLKRSKGYGCLIGLGVGVAAGAVAPDKCESDCMSGAGVIGGAIFGAGIGALVGAFITRSHEVYRAPVASGSVRLSVAPLITPRQKGVTLAYSF